MNRFTHFELRTSRPEAAERFYANIFVGSSLPITLQPPEEIPRGVTPHWLGHIRVEAVEPVVQHWLANGATLLAGLHALPSGAERAIVREAGGGVFALMNGSPTRPTPRVGWHHLFTTHVAKTMARFAERFGWVFQAPTTFATRGVNVPYVPFAWAANEEPIGTMVDVTQFPGSYAHWSFQYEVPDLDAVREATLAGGGLVHPTVVSPTGERVCRCVDPEGAEFVVRGV